MLKPKSLVTSFLKTQEMSPKYGGSHLVTVIAPQLKSTAPWVYIFWVHPDELSTSIAGLYVLTNKKT